MVYICNMKNSGKYNTERWEGLLKVCFIVDRNHQRSVVVVDHFRNIKGI